MRVKWRQNEVNTFVEGIAVGRLYDAGGILRDGVRTKLKSQLNKGWLAGPRKARKPGSKPYKPSPGKFKISRPRYRSGDYADAPWTARDWGTLKRSVRLTKKLTPVKKALSKKRSVRVYAGHYLAFYADIFEYYRPFFRPAMRESESRMKTALGVKSTAYNADIAYTPLH